MGVEPASDAAAYGDDQDVEALAVSVLSAQTVLGVVGGHVHPEPSDIGKRAVRTGRAGLADAGRGLTQPDRVAGRDGDGRALGGQQAGGGQADAGGAPDHQGLPARESEIHDRYPSSPRSQVTASGLSSA